MPFKTDCGISTIAFITERERARTGILPDWTGAGLQLGRIHRHDRKEPTHRRGEHTDLTTRNHPNGLPNAQVFLPMGHSVFPRKLSRILLKHSAEILGIGISNLIRNLVQLQLGSD